ncbi:hypothetical protein GCM10009864_20380 [Streptomyces lunalinharesii]|uniref:Uncharacterized protein n=1 Tax=Streptomyces lunalinharesii TaxID=333384 RepID=A0ABN3RLC0_9ACTN
MARFGTVMTALAIVGFGVVITDVCMPYFAPHKPVRAAADATPADELTSTAAAAPGKSGPDRAAGVPC